MSTITNSLSIAICASAFTGALWMGCSTTPVDAPDVAAATADVAIPPPGPSCPGAGSPFTKPQLQRLCHDQEHPQLSRPPDPGGYCDVEVRLTSSTFETGQGVSEGRGEISFDAYGSAYDVNPPEQTKASSPTTTYNVGEHAGQDLDLGTYRVRVGHTRDVEVCAYFTEHDSGLNGHDDTAFACSTVTLRCSGADANGDGQPDGQATDSGTLGPTTFCGPNQCQGSVSATFEIMAADADMDGVANADDFTPELCDEVNKATAGNAALVYYHYGDSGIRSLAQALGLNFGTVFSAYSYVVLVADNDTSNPMNLNASLFKQADKVFPPTREGLLDAMQDLTSQGFRFDTLVYSHGYKDGADDSSFEVVSGDQITGDWLVSATDPCAIGTARGGVPIMAWYSTTCIAARQIDAWIEIGALSDSGADDVEFFPNASGNFLANWTSGQPYKAAVDSSRTPAVIAASNFEIRQEGMAAPWRCLPDDPSTQTPMDGPGVVTDKNACAEDFFNDNLGPNDAAYNIWEVYDTSLSGAENMLRASHREFLGDPNLKFGASGHRWP